jgi:hypothetical protein
MVKTKSGATAVQVVWSSRRGSREIEHLGSAHDVERTGERATFPGHLDAVDANDRDVVGDFFAK